MPKIFTGIVSSDKNDKTIVVLVRTKKTHPIYKKQYSVSKKILAHDSENLAKIGDKVIIKESRPISARKSHVLVEVVEKAAIGFVETNDVDMSILEKTKPVVKADKETIEKVEKSEKEAKEKQ